MANQAMRDLWDGESGAAWARLEERYDGTLAPWAELLADVAAIGPGEDVLDVGCGFGTTSLDAASRTGPSGAVLGVDLSSVMVARARERAAAAGLDHLRFAVADAQTDDVGADHDVVISRFGIMFFDDPVAAFAHLAASVRPGGRLAVLAWAAADRQEWLTVPAAAALAHVPFPDFGAPGAPGAFALADADRTAGILAATGWSDVAIEPHTRTQRLGGTDALELAMDYVVSSGPGRALLAGAPDDAARERAIAAVREALAARATTDGIPVDGTAWAVTARRQ